MSQGDARRLGARFTAKTVRVTNGAVLDDLREDWIALAGRASEHAMCQTFAYCRAAYDLGVPNDGTAWLLTVFEGSKLAAVWLLQTTREGLFQFLWPLGSGSNDEYGGPLLQMDGERELSQQILAEAVKLRADVFQVFAVPAGTIMCRALEDFQLPGSVREARSLVRYKLTFAHPTTWETFLGSRSKSFRAGLKYDLKRLETLGPVERNWCRTPDEADTIIDWVFDQKKKWARARGYRSGRIFNGRVQEFIKHLSRRIDLNRDPIVTYVKVSGITIAASINFIDSRNIEYAYTTYNEEYSTYSPGKLLIEYCAKVALESERDFDFRMLKADYKDRWSNAVQDIKTFTITMSLKGKLYPLRHLVFQARVGLGKLRRQLVGSFRRDSRQV